MNILQMNKYYLQVKKTMIEPAKFAYFSLSKSFEQQIKTIEDQREKQVKALEKHGKQLIKSSGEKQTLTFLQQK